MPILFSKTQISITPELEEKLKSEPEYLNRAKENEKHLNVYKIVYLSRGLKIVGFVVEPKEKNGNLPCIIWNRGGSGEFGSIKLSQCFIKLGDLAREGYVVIASQYSGGPGSEGEDDFGGDNIEDVVVLRKILQKWPGADAKNIGMWGWSRGGLMTYRTLSLVKWIKAAVIGAAPADEVLAGKQRKGWRDHQISMYGKSKAEQIKRSALYWPEKICKKTPILLLHGTGDWRVNVNNSIRMAEKLVDNKVPVRLLVYEGGDHGLIEFRKESKLEQFKWFERFLKNKEKLPNLKPHGE